MPVSAAEGKAWTVGRIRALGVKRPVTVLDIGPGAGTYARLLAGRELSRMIGLEVWEPYVRAYDLPSCYDEIIVGDARSVDLPSADVIILGDVVEHMTALEALDLWRRSGAAARQAVYLSIPIVRYPQDPVEGNPHERHVVDDWNHERVLRTFDGITDWWTGQVVGVYERRMER